MNQSDFKPRKSLGQNFLVDKNIAQKIINSLSLTKGEVLVEIGFGKGILTNLLLKYPIHYIGVEIDNLLFNNFSIASQNSLSKNLIKGNFLDLDLASISEKYNSKLIVIGNIPYRITSSIFLKLLMNGASIKSSILMIQKEVGERILSSCGKKSYGTLSVICQTFAEIRQLFEVSPNCFWPRPKVWSKVVELTFKENSKVQFVEVQKYFNFVKAIFNKKRKILLNTLEPIFTKEIIYEIGYFPLKKEQLNLRAEQLSPECFMELYSFYRKFFISKSQV